MIYRWSFDVGPYAAIGVRYWTSATVRAATYDEALVKARAKTLRRAQYKGYDEPGAHPLYYHLESVRKCGLPQVPWNRAVEVG